MKTFPSNLSIWALALLLSGGSLAACAQSRVSITQTGAARINTITATPTVDSAKIKLLMPLQQTALKLKKLVATGDPDWDYSFQAKLYEQGLQDFLKQEVQNGKDSTMLQLAKNLLPDVTSNVTMLDNTLRQIKPTRPNQPFTQQQGRNIDAISARVQQMATGDTLTNNYDTNFATLLTGQRQGGIDLATTYLQYGKNDTLRTYAQKLVDDSGKEINRLRTMVKQK